MYFYKKIEVVCQPGIEYETQEVQEDDEDEDYINESEFSGEDYYETIKAEAEERRRREE